MTTLLFLLTLSACSKQKLITSAKKAFNNANCMKTLEVYIRNTECPEMNIHEDQYSIAFRCKKPDNHRGKLWDNYWFRVSHAGLNISEDILFDIESHTVCIDKQHRIEAYPPE